jgi:fatty acid desaturase
MTVDVDQTEPVFAAVEWQTLTLILGTYGAWFALTSAYTDWPWYVVLPLLVVIVTLHSSLQHEAIHGHPTRSARINGALVMMPLSLWLPYAIYRSEHLTHHRDERLTDPIDDPESYYWTAEAWQRLSPLARAVFNAQQTLAGRILIGSWWRIGRFLRIQYLSALRNDPDKREIWALHALLCVPLVLWLILVCELPLWLYVVAVVIPSHGILLIRSFAEHRARPIMRQRIAIVEGSKLLGPLFLFNNLHALHHAAPSIPWYRYNAVYRRTRTQLMELNDGLVYKTYLDVARRYLFRAYDSPQHPQGGVP